MSSEVMHTQHPSSGVTSFDPLAYTTIDFLALALVWVMLSWASGGAAIAGEHEARISAESHISAQATRIAQLQPTPGPLMCWAGTTRVAC